MNILYIGKYKCFGDGKAFTFIRINQRIKLNQAKNLKYSWLKRIF